MKKHFTLWPRRRRSARYVNRAEYERAQTRQTIAVMVVAGLLFIALMYI